MKPTQINPQDFYSACGVKEQGEPYRVGSAPDELLGHWYLC